MYFGSKYVYVDSEEEDEQEKVNPGTESEKGPQNSHCGDSQANAPQEASSGLPITEHADLCAATASAAAAERKQSELSAVLASEATGCDRADQPPAPADAADCHHAKQSEISTAAADCDRAEPSVESVVAADGNRIAQLKVLDAAAAADSKHVQPCAVPAAAAVCESEDLSALSAGVAAAGIRNESDNAEIVHSGVASSENGVSDQPSNEVGVVGSGVGSSQNAASDGSDHGVVLVRSSLTSSRTSASGRSNNESNTNVVCIHFHALVSPVNMHTGEPVRCTNCSVILSHQSRVTEVPEGGHVWQCEFCGCRNDLDINPGEQPRTNDVTYMISPPPQLSSDPNQSSDMMIIFCVDISGSMSVTTEVPGRLLLKGRQVLDNYRRFIEAGYDYQTLPNARRGVTSVTRLQTVQTAIEQQLLDLARDSPTSRAAIIAFNHEVTYLGDGSCEPVTIGEHNLNNPELLVRAGESAPLPGPVRDSHVNLSSKLFQLEECGRTALGPALVMAIAVAGRARVSKVVLCTDGLANVGLGSMEAETSGTASEAQSQPSGAFYEDTGKVAAEKGVSVSILTIEGTTCNLAQLSAIAAHTSGEVKTVDPLKLKEEFSNVVQDDIIATNATATFLVHKSLYIEGEDGEPIIKRVHHGNVRKNSEITFKFGVKKQYRRVLREQLGTAAAAAPEDAAAAPEDAAAAPEDAAAAPEDAAAALEDVAIARAADVSERIDSDWECINSDDQYSDGYEATDMFAMDTEHPQSSGTCRETVAANQAAASAQKECTTTFSVSEAGSASLAGEAPLIIQSHSSLPLTAVPTEGIQSTTAVALSSSAVTAAVQGVPETTASPRCDPSTGPAGDLLSSNDTKSDCPSTATQQDVCFQIQVEYTDRAGGRALRVLTDKKPLTTDRLLTERTMDPSVICAHTWRGAGTEFLSSRSSRGMDILTSGERLLSRSGQHQYVSEGFGRSVRSATGFFRRGTLTDSDSSEVYGYMTRSSRYYTSTGY